MHRRFPKLALALVLAGAPAALAQKNPFLGKWNITGQGAGSNYVYWLEVKDEGGKLSALFLHRGGSPVPVENIKVEGGELSFNLPGRAGQPGPAVRLKTFSCSQLRAGLGAGSRGTGHPCSGPPSLTCEPGVRAKARLVLQP